MPNFVAAVIFFVILNVNTFNIYLIPFSKIEALSAHNGIRRPKAPATIFGISFRSLPVYARNVVRPPVECQIVIG